MSNSQLSSSRSDSASPVQRTKANTRSRRRPSSVRRSRTDPDMVASVVPTNVSSSIAMSASATNNNNSNNNRRNSDLSMVSFMTGNSSRSGRDSCNDSISVQHQEHQREHLLARLDRLARHLPRTVLDQVVKQVVKEEHQEKVLGLCFLGQNIQIQNNESSAIANTTANNNDTTSSSSTRRPSTDSLAGLVDHCKRQRRRGSGASDMTKDALDDGGTDDDDDDDDDDTDNDDEDVKVSKLCQGRHSRNLSETSMTDSLSAIFMDQSVHDHASASASGGSLNGVFGASAVPLVATPKTRLENSTSESALLFLDISGFTALSRSLEVESLSKVINAYFQSILEIIYSFQGDVLKFAGDALLIEWKQKAGDDEPSESACLLATICAAKLVECCSDFAVQVPALEVKGDNPTSILLNIHCAVAFGSVVGTHVGNHQRMEYVLVGDGMKQISLAMTHAKLGQVVASPEAIQALEPYLLFPAYTATDSDNGCVVLACKSKLHYKPIDKDVYASIVATSVASSAGTSDDEHNISEKCRAWNTNRLRRLEKRIAPYVHTATSPEISSSGISIARRRSRHTAEGAAEVAELREVVTVFLQPILPSKMDCTSPDEETLDMLQKIMTIVQSEVDHFGGQLRQFMMDDKGLVIIFNWGLRGSTYPNMVEERALPCMINIRTLLRTELDVESRMGGTFGHAYVGVVGGILRHEYAILAPTVNLSARLCFSKANPGVLVDRALKSKAGGSNPFKVRRPITAKGYDEPVRIYEPAPSVRKSWLEISKEAFVGRSKEVAELTTMAFRILNDDEARETSKLAFISAPAGYGKSCLLSRATSTIEALCSQRKASNSSHMMRHVFCDDDAFRPFSIVRPLFLDILRRKQNPNGIPSANDIDPNDKELQKEMQKQEEAQLHLLFLQACLQTGIPMQYIEMFAGIIFSDKLSDDIGKWSDKLRKMSDWNTLVKHIVRVYLQMTKDFDLVVLAMDEVTGVDEMSWKIIQRLIIFSNRFLVMAASRNQHGLNIRGTFWEELGSSDHVRHVPLAPMASDDIEKLACKFKSCPASPSMPDRKSIATTVLRLSEGVPSVAAILLQLYDSTSSQKGAGIYDGSNVDDEVKDVLLNRLDALPTSARLHLQCGAILGLSFSLSDIVSVMEKYNCIDLSDAEAKSLHLEEVCSSLTLAEQSGFLASTSVGAGIVMYSFTHSLWQDEILHQTLQDWKDRVRALVDSVIRPAHEIPKHDLSHNLTPTRTKPSLRAMLMRS